MTVTARRPKRVVFACPLSSAPCRRLSQAEKQRWIAALKHHIKPVAESFRAPAAAKPAVPPRVATAAAAPEPAAVTAEELEASENESEWAQEQAEEEEEEDDGRDELDLYNDGIDKQDEGAHEEAVRLFARALRLIAVLGDKVEDPSTQCDAVLGRANSLLELKRCAPSLPGCTHAVPAVRRRATRRPPLPPLSHTHTHQTRARHARVRLACARLCAWRLLCVATGMRRRSVTTTRPWA